ncbi:MAG: YCF48-related protein [Arcicella sp.]|nr:YCF48-related protein [Arcicella sp.]
MKKLLLLIILFSSGFWFNTYAQKGSPSPKTGTNPPQSNSANCPLVVAIQDNTPSATCSELQKILVAVSSACTDTTAVSYQWSSSIGGVFSTLRTTTFNLPEFLVATPVTFTVVATEGSESASASYTITVKPRPNRPSLTPFGTIILCDNAPITLTSSTCTGGSTTVWSNGVTGSTSISVPAIGGTFFKVACERNGCVSDSTAAAALITGIATQAPTTTSRTICEGTTITAGNGLQAQLTNCATTGYSSTHTYTGGTVGYDQGYRSTGSSDPSVSVPATTGLIRKVSISITWRKQKGGFQNSCGTGDTESWPYHSETQFRVQSPSGTIVTLVYTGSYGGENNPTVTTVFEDGANPINYYSPPVSGTFAPAQPLSAFIGENPTGTWTLLPYDAVWKDPLCVSGFAVTFSDIQDGNITWWDAPTGGNQVGTGAEFIPNVTAAGTYTYYAQGKCSRGCPSIRTATTLTINPTPVAPAIDINVPVVNSSRSICHGESVTLTATSCDNGGTVKWSSNIQGANFATGASYTFTPSGNSGFNTNHTFTAICEGANLCKSVSSNTISLIVKFKPAVPTISGPGSTACINTNVTLMASGCSGGTIGWTGNRTGNPLNFIISNNVSVKAACTINGCTSDSTTAYVISTLPKPATPNINASQVQAICIGGSVTLSSNCANGTTTRWTGGLTGSPVTITPTTTRSYRASCLGTNGCASDSSVALNIVVLPKTKPTIAGNTFVCGPSSVTLTASGCSGANETVMWRDESTGNTYTQNVTQTLTFRAVCIRNGYCVSDSSDIFTVQYRNKPSQPSVTAPTNTTVCQGSSVVLTASACSGGTLGWTSGLTGSSITISAVGTRAYKAACTINNCTSDSSLAVSITVLPAPVFTVSANKTSICGGESATLTAAGCTGTLSWTGGSTTSSITVSPTVTTNYTATCTVNSCSSTQQITITPLQTPSVMASGVLQCNGTPVTLTATNVPSGSTIQWRKDGVDIAGATGTTYSTSVAGSYDFKVGATFSLQLQLNTTSASDIRFVDSNNGYILNANNLWKTTNGGTNWVNIYSHTSNFEDVYFIDSNNGWAITQQNILKTTNGGLNWTLYNNNWSGLTLSKLHFKDVNTGIILTNDGRSLSTTNGGVAWNLNTNPIESNINSWQFNKLMYIPNTNNILLAYRINGSSTAKLTKSTDNGATWTVMSLPNVSYLSSVYDISFANSSDGWLVGYEYDKLLLKTTDGGNTWTRLNPVMSSGNYIKTDFVSSQIGYVMGFDGSTYTHKIYKTKDGGSTWNVFRVIENDYTNTLNLKLDFMSEDNGWYFYLAANLYQYILRKASPPQCPTTPAVLTAPQSPAAPSIATPSNSTICQGSSITLSATGCAGTYTWTGGLTGSSVSVSPTVSKNYKVVCTIGACTSDSSSVVLVTVLPAPVFTVSANKTSICGGESAILTAAGCTGTLSWTGGATTSSITVSPTVITNYTATCTVNSCSSTQQITITSLQTPSVTASGILQCNGTPVTLTATNVPSGSSIQWRKDGIDIAGVTGTTCSTSVAGSYDFKVGAMFSTSLSIVSNNANNYLRVIDVQFIDENIGYCSLNNVIRKTTNGGITWNDVYALSEVKDIFFINANIGWAITNSNVAKTTDGGATWNLYNNPTLFNNLIQIHFKDNNNGVILATNKTFITSDGGNTWSASTNFSGTPSPYEIVIAPNSNNIYWVGNESISGNTIGGIYKSSDNGNSWSRIFSANNVDLREIQFVNQNVGWVTANSANLYKTIDGGNTWSLVSSNPIGSPMNTDFISEQIGYLFGLGGIYKTINGGSNWNLFRDVQGIDVDNSGLINHVKGIDFTSDDNGWYFFGANYGSPNKSYLKKVAVPQCSTIPAILVSNCCNGIESLKSGSWSDPTTWSCNRVPTATDDVIINTGHIITETSSPTIRAKTLTYRGGILQIPQATTLRLGNQ